MPGTAEVFMLYIEPQTGVFQKPTLSLPVDLEEIPGDSDRRVGKEDEKEKSYHSHPGRTLSR